MRPFVIKSIGRKEKRYKIYFRDGSLASNRTFKSYANAVVWLNSMNRFAQNRGS